MLNRRAFEMWTAALIAVFCVAVMVFAYVSRRPLCIDSRLVEKIDRVTENGTHSAYRCAVGNHVLYDGKLNQITQNFGQRLAPLEKFFDYLGGRLQNRVSITMLKTSDIYFKIQDHQIYASEDFLNSPGQLEKAMIKIWLRERHQDQKDQKSEEPFEGSLFEEVFSDFFWTTAKGRLDVYDPLSKSNLADSSKAMWPEVLKSSVEVCRSPWWPEKSTVICQTFSETHENHENDSEIDPDSLRPLLTQSLTQAYERISAFEKMAWLKDFAVKINRFEPFHLDHASDYAQAQAIVRQWIASLCSMDEEFGRLVVQELASRGFHDLSTTVRFNALVIFDSAVKDKKVSIQKNLQHLEQTHLIGYETNEQVQFSAQGALVPLSELGIWQADKIVFAGCGSPPLEKLRELSTRAERLLFIDLCQSKGDIDVSSYLDQDAQLFAAQNKDVNFIEFHLPSLMLALQKIESNGKKNENWIADLLRGGAGKSSEKTFVAAEALGWQAPIYQSKLKAYRSQSVIEAINWYRIR